MKDTNDAHSSIRLFLRCFTPSLASAVGGLFISIVLVMLHVLFFSLDKGSFTPGISTNQWIETYTDFIIHPVEIVIHNSTLNTVLTAVLWGLLGLVIYTLLEAGINTYHTLQDDKHNVHVIDSQKIQIHPLRRTVLMRALWRVLISITAVLLLVLTGTLSHRLLVNLDDALAGTSAIMIIYWIILTVAAWTILTHLFIVLLRLFVFRTRVLGEVIH